MNTKARSRFPNWKHLVLPSFVLLYYLLFWVRMTLGILHMVPFPVAVFRPVFLVAYFTSERFSMLVGLLVILLGAMVCFFAAYYLQKLALFRFLR